MVLSTASGAPSVLKSPMAACQLALTDTSLAITTNGNTAVQLLASFTPARPGTYRLLLRAPGMLVLQDSTGLALWSSTGSCASATASNASGCFTTQMHGNCTLSVLNEAGRVVWALPPAGSSSRVSQLRQLVSYGSTSVSCIEANASFSSLLSSASAKHQLSIGRTGQADMVVTSTGAVVWQAVGATVPASSASLCLQPDGSLRISSRGATLWTSSYWVPAAANYSEVRRSLARCTPCNCRMRYLAACAANTRMMRCSARAWASSAACQGWLGVWRLVGVRPSGEGCL
jgi:hypothetical protein